MNTAKNEKKIAELLHKNCKLSLEQLATMTEMTIDEVAAAIDALEASKTILGYGAIVDWDKIQGSETVTAYIEIQVAPQRNRGFDRLAERIYQYPEVKSLNLMSGHYDFGVIVEAANIQEIAMFVSERLAPMESILDTSTHFVLKRYKSDGVIYASKPEDDREVISL